MAKYFRSSIQKFDNWLFWIRKNQSYFSVPKDLKLNSTHYFVMKINIQRELQNIAINHSADIDYKDFAKIYREYTKQPYSFLTIDTISPASDLLRFRKIYFLLIKMTVTDQIKILDRNHGK